MCGVGSSTGGEFSETDKGRPTDRHRQTERQRDTRTQTHKTDKDTRTLFRPYIPRIHAGCGGICGAGTLRGVFGGPFEARAHSDCCLDRQSLQSRTPARARAAGPSAAPPDSRTGPAHSARPRRLAPGGCRWGSTPPDTALAPPAAVSWSHVKIVGGGS